MSAYQLLSETIPEIESDNLFVDPNENLYDLNEKMIYVSQTIGQDFIKLKKNINRVSSIFEQIKTPINDFDKQELIEEQLDSMIYEYAKIKQYLKKGRIIRYYKEQKEKTKIFIENE